MEKKYRGVRKKSSGRFSAEITLPKLRRQKWLGTFDTAEQAAFAYDMASMSMRGSNAYTNFLHVNRIPYNQSSNV